MQWIESRLHLAEQRLEMLYRRLTRDEATLDNVRQQLRGAYQQGASQGGGGSPIYFGCTLSAALAHGSNVTGQTVWKLSGGSRANVTTNGKVYNDGPATANDIASGKQVILAANDDGTWTVIGVYC
jgi:hypothetical protein